jgi:hypothetical protein
MRSSVDKRIILAAALAVVAVVLTILNDRRLDVTAPQAAASVSPQMSREVISAIVDSTLKRMGVSSIHHTQVAVDGNQQVRMSVRIKVPVSFESLKLLRVLRDSVSRFGVRLVATENLREHSSSVHLISHNIIFESIVMSREQQKGVVPSVRRKLKSKIR